MGGVEECGVCGHPFPTVGLRIHHEQRHDLPHEPAKEPTMTICLSCALAGHLVSLSVFGVRLRCPDCLATYTRP